MSLKNIDLHLLQCFQALVTERSVTKAAERMGMSQPGMSNVLARLRDVLADPILVRTPQGMMLTPKAMGVTERVREALDQLAAALASPERFIPAAAREKFNIVCLDYTALLAIAPIASALRQQAPHIEITITALANLRIREPLEEGSVDLVIGYFVDLPPGLFASHLQTDELCCVGHRDSIQEQPTLEAYIEASHCLLIMPQGPLTTMELITEGALNKLNLKRKVWLHVPYMSLLAAVVGQSDLVATLPMGAALQFSRTLPIVSRPLPFQVPPYTISMVWHERTHKNPAFVWIRQQLREGYRRAPFQIADA